jgi:3-phosphoshikimate 1-carboxyvinyltransferase
MILTVKPAAFLRGRIHVPASKSYSIRAFIIAACGGTSTIINPSNSEDGKVSIQAARFLGARIIKYERATGSKWRVAAHWKRTCRSEMNVKESGTVLRFLLPLAALWRANITVTGEGTLHGRPNLFLTRTLRYMGIAIEGTGKGESVPVTIRGGTMKGGKIIIDGSLSSQFISALLIACPQLGQNSHLMLRGKRLVSSDYIEMTEQILRRSGIRIEKRNVREYTIKGNQKFRGLKNFTVPSDFGLAAFHMSAAVLTDSDVLLTGSFNKALVQADSHILSLLKRMGVTLGMTSKGIHIKGPYALRGGKFSLANCPDLVPVMAILALFAKGKTCLYNIYHVRSKESDRISDLRTELLKVGAKITEKRDSLTIDPQDAYRTNCLLDPHHDHRLAMAFCILGLKLGVRVKDIECSRKSYPDFVRDLRKIGVVTCIN